MKNILLSALLLAGTAATLSANVLLLDFGPTGVISTQATNAPYSTGLSSSSTWNTIGTADPAGVLSFADGTSSGASLNLGASGNSFTGGTSSVNFGTQPTGSNAGTNSGSLLVNESPAKDFVFTGTTGQNTAVGISVSGLAAGDYDIYLVGYNSAAATTNRGMQFWAGATTGAPTTSFADVATWSTASVTNGSFSSWTEGTNYAVLSVSITAGENLTILSHGTNASELRGFLNLVEIVQTSTIPEPSTWTLLFGGVAFGVVVLRRRFTR